jgi:membrane protease YdiL (CAAX protease family)
MTPPKEINQQKQSRPVNYLLTFLLVMVTFLIFSILPFWLESSLTGRIVLNDLDNLTRLAELLGKNVLLVYLLVPFVASTAMLISCVQLIHAQKILSVFTTRNTFDWKRFWFSFFLWGLLMSLFLLFAFSKGSVLHWNFHPKEFIVLLLISLVLVPIQTTFEELLFRGFLFQWMDHFQFRGWIIILFTGGLFGLMHYNNPEIDTLGPFVICYYILTGIFLGILARMDEGLELSMGYHAINNLFAALIVTNSWQAFQTDALIMDTSPPTFGWDNYLTLLIVQPLMLFVFSKKYGWKSFTEKLLQKGV